MNTAGPTISNDQQLPKQLSPDSGEEKPLSKLTSVSKASKAHGFDQTLTTKVYAQPSDMELYLFSLYMATPK